LYKSVCSLFDAIGICVGFVAQTAHCYRLLKKFILKKLESKAKADIKSKAKAELYDLRRKMREDFNMVFQ
jgi:hypothetical protein